MGQSCFDGRGRSLAPQTLGPSPKLLPSSWSGGYIEALCHNHFRAAACVCPGEWRPPRRACCRCQSVARPTHHQPDTPQVSGSVGSATKGKGPLGALHAASGPSVSPPRMPRATAAKSSSQRRNCSCLPWQLCPGSVLPTVQVAPHHSTVYAEWPCGRVHPLYSTLHSTTPPNPEARP